MEINESIKDLFEPELMEEILAVGKKKTAKEGEVIISIGQRLLFMPIVLQGTVKVSMIYLLHAGSQKRDYGRSRRRCGNVDDSCGIHGHLDA